MNEFADMVSKEVRCSLANDFGLKFHVVIMLNCI